MLDLIPPKDLVPDRTAIISGSPPDAFTISIALLPCSSVQYLFPRKGSNNLFLICQPSSIHIDPETNKTFESFHVASIARSSSTTRAQQRALLSRSDQQLPKPKLNTMISHQRRSSAVHQHFNQIALTKAFEKENENKITNTRTQITLQPHRGGAVLDDQADQDLLLFLVFSKQKREKKEGKQPPVRSSATQSPCPAATAQCRGVL